MTDSDTIDQLVKLGFIQRDQAEAARAALGETGQTPAISAKEKATPADPVAATESKTPSSEMGGPSDVAPNQFQADKMLIRPDDPEDSAPQNSTAGASENEVPNAAAAEGRSRPPDVEPNTEPPDSGVTENSDLGGSNSDAFAAATGRARERYLDALNAATEQMLAHVGALETRLTSGSDSPVGGRSDLAAALNRMVQLLEQNAAQMQADRQAIQDAVKRLDTLGLGA